MFLNKRFTFFTGSFLYFILIALSFVFYKERTIMFDTAFQLFQILFTNDFAIQVNRFGSAITQAFPLFASRLNFSLEHITMIYSAGYNLFYFASFLIVLLIFKNTKLAWVNLLFTIGITTHTFFWIQCELVQGVIFTTIFLAHAEYAYRQQKTNYWFYVLLPFYLITIVFFHPLLPFVLLFALGFYYLHYHRYLKLTLLISASFIVLYFLKSIFFKTDYDSSAMGGLNNFKWLFPNYFTIQANKNFLHYCLQDYYFIPIIFLTVSIFYLIKKNILKLLFLCSFFFGYLMIVNVSHQGGGDQFYLESQYLLLIFFLSFPLLYDVLPTISVKHISNSILVSIALIGLIRIYKTENIYHERLQWFEKTIAEVNSSHQKKVVLNPAFVPMKKIILSWGSAYEFWLLSTITYNKSLSIIIPEKDAEFDDAINNKSVFIGKWQRINYSEFKNKKCFVFNDSTGYTKQ